jgi:hypothetical protein
MHTCPAMLQSPLALQAVPMTVGPWQPAAAKATERSQETQAKYFI